MSIHSLCRCRGEAYWLESIEFSYILTDSANMVMFDSVQPHSITHTAHGSRFNDLLYWVNPTHGVERANVTGVWQPALKFFDRPPKTANFLLAAQAFVFMRLSSNNGYQPLPTHDESLQSSLVKSTSVARSVSDNTIFPATSSKPQRGLPYKTKRFIKRRLSAAGLKTTKMSSATYAPLPPTIINDIDNGDLSESEDEKGWVIVMRRRKRSHTFDNGLGKSTEEKVYKSVFVKHGTVEDRANEVYKKGV